MTKFLFGFDGNNQDIEPQGHVGLPNLEFLKINHASIGETSYLRGRRSSISGEKFMLPPPLSQLPKLISLSLAYNEIRKVKTALSGLIHLPNLIRLDLSYNQIKSMRGADVMLGNIKVLVLTGNLLTNVEGLVKLYGLESLHLDGNKINDVSKVAGIGNLPYLMNIFLKGNPFTDKDPLVYRIKVLDFFKSTRFYSLLPGATYRALLHILPLVDGKSATKRELVALKSLTFRQASTIANASIDGSAVSQSTERDRVSNGIAGHFLHVISSTRKVTRKVQSSCYSKRYVTYCIHEIGNRTELGLSQS
jgi:Leucine-rich repeat (LRR) protein